MRRMTVAIAWTAMIVAVSVAQVPTSSADAQRVVPSDVDGSHDSRSASTAGEVSNPVVEGPVEGGVRGYPWNHTVYDLVTATYNYTEKEYFFSGTATHLPDGRTAPYKSRLLARFPRDAREFNGTVLIEWMNVTNGQDWEYNWWPPAHEYLMEQGYGHVVVSAQAVGVSHLHQWDPQRYATLLHPGDDFSFDIFAQAVEAVRDGSNNATSPTYPRAVDPTGGLAVDHIVAGGVSQSAGRLATFINDGYNRGRIDAYNLERALGSRIEDYSTFIFELNEETSFTGRPAAPRPPDSNKYVVWEEAGTAHHPRVWWDYTFTTQQRDLYAPGIPDPVNAGCSVNRGRIDYSVRAMLFWTQRYLQTGEVPPSAPRIERQEDNSPVRDADGLVVGGLRHPFVEVPVALNRATTDDCVNWGTYQPWSDNRILARYPTHANYVGKVRRWANHEVAQGWLLPQDRDRAIADAKKFTAPWRR